MTFADVKVQEVIDALQDYIAWHKNNSADPISRVRAQKGEEILAVLQKTPNNHGFYQELVEDIYTLFNECSREAFNCKRLSEGLSFKDAFYYIYNISVNEIRIETKIKKYVADILPYYKTKPERAISFVAEAINASKKNEEYGKEFEEKKSACVDIILFLTKLI